MKPTRSKYETVQGALRHFKHIRDEAKATGNPLDSDDWELHDELQRIERQESGALPWQQERQAAVEIAASEWTANPGLRIGAVVATIKGRLYESDMKVPERDDTIKKWLSDAEQKGALSIPKSARKGGRPRKTP